MTCTSSNFAKHHKVLVPMMSKQLKNNTGERKLRVTFLSAEWKTSSYGDLTTINRELAIQMAKHPIVEVSVFLPQCSGEDKKDADSYNVKLIEAVKLHGLKPVLWLASVPDGHVIDCVVGHGVALGQQISLIKKNPNYSNCKWIQVVHTAPEEIGMYKSISDGQQMQKTEVELCKMADQVVTIGPKLTDVYKHQLRKQDVFNLTPSIFTEFSDVQQVSNESRSFYVLVTESGYSEDFYVKGYDIAVKAIAILKDKSYKLKFASKQRGKEDELAVKLFQCGIGPSQLVICSFDENRETLANLFSAVDIAILPSKTEGFGLSALEAISAGLPVLVSGNSGIAEALKEVPNGPQCIVDSEDPADWARAIKAVRNKKRNVRLEEAKFLCGNYLQKYNWEESCDFLVEKMRNLAFGGELNVKVAVDDLKPEEQNMQTGMLATESVRCQEVQQLGASATSAASGSVSYPQTEDLKASKERDFQLIFRDCYHSTKPQSIEEWNWFREHLKEMRVIITGVSDGSLVITVKCESLMILEEFWADYSSGHLGEVVQNCFVTEKILKELNLAELRLKTTIDIEEYNTCKMFFEEDALRGALSSEFYSTSSTSESPLKKEQWEKSEQKTKIMETVELKGTSRLIVVPTTSHGKELEEPWGRKGMLPLPGSSTFDPEKEPEEPPMKLQRIKGSSSPPFVSTTDLEQKLGKVCEDIKRLRMEGSFPVLSTINLENKLAELSMELQRVRMEGTLPPPELFTADIEEELKGLRRELNRQGVKGSSPFLVFIIEIELEKVLEKLQKGRTEALEIAMYPTIRSGLVKFDVSLPEELQSYVSYLLNESAKLGLRRRVLQSPRALEELRKAMDQDELKTFLTIHIREGAWQVVLLFMDELPGVKLPWDWYRGMWDKEVSSVPLYSSTSGILKAWPTEYDPDLITLCRAITNRDWKVTRLILSSSRISDEGLKNLSTALTQSEVYSLTLDSIGLQSQGLKHLCDVLINGDCKLTSLNFSDNSISDVGIMHLCNALTSVNCTLTSLNVIDTRLGNKGIMRLCNALTSCRLTDLNACGTWQGEEGIMLLFPILTNSKCTLTSLNISHNRLGGKVLKDLPEALTNKNCTLTSLDISYNELGDEEIKYLCKALTDTNCKLESLNLQGNRNITDVGKQCLFKAITDTDWEVREGLILCRSIKSKA